MGKPIRLGGKKGSERPLASARTWYVVALISSGKSIVVSSRLSPRNQLGSGYAFSLFFFFFFLAWVFLDFFLCISLQRSSRFAGSYPLTSNVSPKQKCVGKYPGYRSDHLGGPKTAASQLMHWAFALNRIFILTDAPHDNQKRGTRRELTMTRITPHPLNCRWTALVRPHL